VAGVLVDRSRRRPVLVTTDLVRGGLLVAVPLLAFTQHLTMVVLAAFMVIFGPSRWSTTLRRSRFCRAWSPPRT
jgi:hypothetical protein